LTALLRGRAEKANEGKNCKKETKLIQSPRRPRIEKGKPGKREARHKNNWGIGHCKKPRTISEKIGREILPKKKKEIDYRWRAKGHEKW